MSSIFQFLYKHLHWIVFIVLEIICFVLLFSYNSFQGSVYLSTANQVTARLLNGKNRVTSYFELAEMNQALARQNAKLQQRVVELETMADIYRLDSLAQTESIDRIRRSGYHISPARVIDKSVNKSDNYLTIDRGTADGIVPDMGVMGIDGVVGIVYKCTEHYSLVMPLLNRNSSISCKVYGSDYFGYLQWQGNDSRYAMLHDLPRYADVKIGDTIVTSGNSSFFPEGITVGNVTNVYPSTDEQYMKLQVQLSTQFARIEHVFAIRKIDNEELETLQELLHPKKKKK